jgi:hypothetical protein
MGLAALFLFQVEFDLAYPQFMQHLPHFRRARLVLVLGHGGGLFTGDPLCLLAELGGIWHGGSKSFSQSNNALLAELGGIWHGGKVGYGSFGMGQPVIASTGPAARKVPCTFLKAAARIA